MEIVIKVKKNIIEQIHELVRENKTSNADSYLYSIISQPVSWLFGADFVSSSMMYPDFSHGTVLYMFQLQLQILISRDICFYSLFFAPNM